jgi:hypothetical protein
MELMKALQVAVAFATKSKDLAESLQAVRFFSRTEGHGRVAACTDRVGVVINVDMSLPDALVPVGDVKPSSKQAASAVDLTDNSLRIWNGRQRVFDLERQAVEGFPPFPEAPEKWVTLDPDEVKALLSVAHAVDRTGVIDLRTVEVTDRMARATNASRWAAAEGVFPFSGKLPYEFFTWRWPKGKVEMGETATHVWALVGDQWRWARKLTDIKYTKLDPFVVEAQELPYAAITDTEALLQGVKAGVDVSATKTICVRLTADPQTMGGELQLIAYMEDETVTAYNATMVIDSIEGEPWPEPVAILVAGKWFLEALKQIDTPMVRLSFEGDVRPLMIEGGPFVEVLYPRLGG